MIQRYSRPEMLRIWSEDAKYQNWLRIEIAVCEAWAKLGRIPVESLANIKERASFNAIRVEELEKTLKHDVIAFLTCVSEYVGEESRYIHVGLTSSDVLDTSFALQLRDAATIIVDDLKQVIEVLRGLAYKHKYTPMIGRTHGIHAEPITLGLAFALWYDEMKRNLDRMERARDVVSVGKISGAVGTFANVPPFVEERVCSVLGLKPAKVSTQIIQRDIHAEYFLTLSIIASTIEKIALQIRHFQRTEVIELEEAFTQGQKGSSAMPHKRNPVLSENLCGLSRLVRSYAISALENIPLWHERDISHSSVERVIGPDATVLVDFMLYRLRGLMEKLVIYPDMMLKNLEMTKGVIFSQMVMLRLVEKGASREGAYAIVQRNAMKSWELNHDFKKLLFEDGEVMSYLEPQELESLFKNENFIKHVDFIFDRIFGDEQ